MFKRIFIISNLALIISVYYGVYVFAAPLSTAVVYEEKSFDISGNTINASIITVDLSNYEISMSASVAGSNVRGTENLEKLVQAENPVFLISVGDIDKNGPKGNFMSDGELIFSTAGQTSMGVTEKSEIIFAKPMIFTKLYTTDNSNKRALSWTIRDINSLEQTGEASVLYTPNHGSGLEITSPGWAMTVESSVISAFFRVEAGRQINIPSDGYIVFFSDKFANTTYFVTPEIGRVVSKEHIPMTTDGSEFPLDRMSQIVSGNTRIVEDSKMSKSLAVLNNNSRAISLSAVGTLTDGRLIFVVAQNASWQELGEILIKCGCTDAISLLSGDNCAVYVNGMYLTSASAQVPSALIVSKGK